MKQRKDTAVLNHLEEVSLELAQSTSTVFWGLSGYARIDYRLTEDGQIFVLEVKANPQIAQNENFADSAKYCGVKYGSLLQKILTLGMSYNAMA